MRVEDDLKPHNIETIDKVLEFYKTEKKCCAIQATGTGKTYLILRLLEIFKDEGKKAVIFAPNREIIRQTKKKMKSFKLENAVLYTYQKLAKMSSDAISNIDADLIVCDELHRTGAKTWGNKFTELVESHPDSKIFGVTATPLRCSDGRDMAEEYFDGNKACDISLADALVREIIPVMPVYVSALYTFEEEYQKMSDKIDSANNSDEEKIELQKELSAAKQQLEKANGVPQIIKKYITNYNGKYLVFCKDKKHLYEMKDTVIKWFREAEYVGKVFEYPYYSNNSKVKQNLLNFENNHEEGLKLLFIIDKLNEGLHLDEIHGCILLRTTTSNIIYYQQIGRAIDAGSNEKRVILDLVSNFNSLKSFNLKDELQKSIKKRKSGSFPECTEEFEVSKFEITDYVQPCVDVFCKIDLQLQDSWWKKFEDYKSDLKVNNVTRNKYKGFIASIKKSFEQNKLDDDKYIALREIGFVFDKNYKSFDWFDYYNVIKKISNTNDVNTINRDTVVSGLKIGQWIHQQRNSYQKGKLSSEQTKLLESIGLIWNKFDVAFLNNIQELDSFIILHGEYPTLKTNKSLFHFVSTIRKKNKVGKLNEDRIKMLDSISFVYDKLEYEWNKKYKLCQEYVTKMGRLPVGNVIFKEENIGWWIGTQKKSIMTNNVTSERLILLEKLGIEIDKYKVA